MPPDLPLFSEIAALVAVAALIAAIGTALRQPLVVSFLVTGLVVGPDALDLVHSEEPLELLADLGVAVLLFLVGLKLDLRLVRTLGAVAVVTGVGQIVFTAGIGALLCLALGMSAIESAYVAVALTFSSTIIIVKLLSDKREIDSLHGRVALGFLIVQDLAVVLVMALLSTFGPSTPAHAGEVAGWVVLVRGGALIGGAILFARFAAEPASRFLARTPELLATSAIGWALLLTAAAEWAGLGKELGALIAGVALASTGARDAVASRLTTVRDFLLLFFFLALGAGMDLDVLAASIGASLALSAFVLVGNPLIVMALMGALGYRKRTGMLAGLTVAQISEFSLVFVAMGVSLGHVGDEVVGVVTLVGLITIAGSTYMILYSHPLYERLAPWLGVFERKNPHREAGAPPERAPNEVLVVGLGRYGSRIGGDLVARGVAVLGVDFDPEAVARWRDGGHPALLGDASDSAMLEALPPGLAAVVVALPPVRTGALDVDPRFVLAESIRAAGHEGPIFVAVGDDLELEALARVGAEALRPHEDSAHLAAQSVLAALGRAG